jgi:hypothetical protein
MILSFCRIPPETSEPEKPVFYSSKAKYSGIVIFVTTVTWILLVSVAIWTLLLSLNNNTPITGLLTTSLIAGILTVPYLFSPKAFELSKNGVIVKRPLRSFAIPYPEITGISITNLSWKGVRLWASGGFYGFFGLFYVSNLGSVWIYVTRRENIVLIETKNWKYAISPEDPRTFLKRLETLVGNTTVNGGSS